jgi:hypothetical protein
MLDAFPVVFMAKECWRDLGDFALNTRLRQGCADENETSFLLGVDSPEEAIRIIR